MSGGLKTNSDDSVPKQSTDFILTETKPVASLPQPKDKVEAIQWLRADKCYSFDHEIQVAVRISCSRCAVTKPDQFAVLAETRWNEHRKCLCFDRCMWQ